ncbi:MAG TPA: hypothetical protein VH186_39055 [Chloroflexia bacterium]|nr:hypothetical protein [Chloroflexia bacterium]
MLTGDFEMLKNMAHGRFEKFQEEVKKDRQAKQARNVQKSGNQARELPSLRRSTMLAVLKAVSRGELSAEEGLVRLNGLDA